MSEPIWFELYEVPNCIGSLSVYFSALSIITYSVMCNSLASETFFHWNVMSFAHAFGIECDQLNGKVIFSKKNESINRVEQILFYILDPQNPSNMFHPSYRWLVYGTAKIAEPSNATSRGAPFPVAMAGESDVMEADMGAIEGAQLPVRKLGTFCNTNGS